MNYIVPMATLLVALVSVMAFRASFRGMDWVVKPHHNQTCHATPVGGLAIFCSLLTVTLLMPIQPLPLFLMVGFPLMVVNLVDDVYGVEPIARLLAQALVMYLFCVINHSYIPVNQFLPFWPHLPVIFDYLALMVFGMSWMNAGNFIDGIDGLCISQNAAALIVLCGIYAGYTHSGLQVLLWPILALLGCLFLFNLSRSCKVFLGDHGAVMLSFLSLALLAQLAKFHSGTAAELYTWGLWLYAVPLLDMIAVIIVRRSSKRGLSVAAFDHIHHVLMHKGFSVLQINGILFLVGILTACSGLAFLIWHVNVWVSLLTWACCAVAYTTYRLRLAATMTDVYIVSADATSTAA